MFEQITSLAALVGRLLLSLIFLLSGLMKITTWDQQAAYMETHGMPAIPLLLTGAILVELGGGLCLLFGYYARLVLRQSSIDG